MKRQKPRPLVVRVFPAGLAALGLACAASLTVKAEDQPPQPEPPRVVLVSPLTLSPGGGPKVLRLRGVGLAEASAVRFPDAKAAIKADVKSKGAADVPPNLDAKVVGDAQVEVEVTLPDDTPAGPLPLVVVTPQGETKAATVL